MQPFFIEVLHNWFLQISPGLTQPVKQAASTTETHAEIWKICTKIWLDFIMH